MIFEIPTFMFAVLGSLTFWIVYGLVTMVMTVICMRILFPYVLKGLKSDKPLEVVKKGWHSITYGYEEYIGSLLICFLFWPIIVWGVIVYAFVYYVLGFIAKIFYQVFRWVICKVDDTIPNVKVVKEERE